MVIEEGDVETVKKKFISVMLLAVMTISLGACGEKGEVPRYGLVTNSAGIGTDSVNAEIWSSIQDAAGTEYSYKYYTAEEDTKKGMDAQFDAAAKEGTELVFADGKDMETAVFRAQRAHHKIRYILVDGAPRKNERDKEPSFRENTTSIAFATQDEGYIAGYGAVRNGYRNIGFIAGGENDKTDRYLSGYLQGAEQAAAELNLGSGEVKLTAVIAESDELSPLRMTDALILYKQGAEVIFAVGSNIATAVAKASQSTSKPFIAGGVDMNNVTTSCIFSTVSFYKQAIDAAIDDFESEEGLPGGEVVYYGAADKAIKIVADYTRLSSFTETDYNNIVRQIMEGTVTVSGEKVTEGTAHVQLNLTAPPSGLDESSAAAVSGAVSTTESTPAANTGTSEATEENTEGGEEEYTEEEYTEEEYTEDGNTEEENNEEDTEEGYDEEYTEEEQ
ncbi:MAG TPA: hypothetical protein DCG37_01675 [Lachnospiraceae bacterium]|nr:hypothetical protein [Lachnospiraceae bacterium]